jgi:hypothetical protein
MLNDCYNCTAAATTKEVRNTGFGTRVMRRLTLVEQELPTLPEHLGHTHRGSCGIETVVMTGNGYICNNVRWLFDFEIRTFEDTKRVIKSCKSKRTDSTMTKKRQTQHSKSRYH